MDADAWTLIIIEKSVMTWFDKFHPCFPIVHEDSTRRALRLNNSRYYYILKAISAVVIYDDDHATPQDRQAAGRMRDEVMHHGMTAASLQSIQALLILSNHYYTHGHLVQFWNVLAMCQR